MGRFIAIATLIAGLSLPSTVSAVSLGPQDQCVAVAPAAPQCSFTVSENTSGPVSGAAGQGDWLVKIKRGKAKLTLQPSGTEPEAVSFMYMKGDKVSVLAKTPGTGVIAGGD